MRLTRLLVLIAVLACLCASAQASIGAVASAAESARRGFLPEPATTSRAIDRATAGHVWEKSGCGREAASGSCVSAFGEEIGRSGSTPVEHLYRGERFDANAGLYDLRARLYNASNGRFLTQDTFAGFGQDPRSLHKYAYASANPVLYVDPSGKFSLVEAQVSAEIANILANLQVDNGFEVLGSLGLGENEGVRTAQAAAKIVGLASLGAAGIKLIKFLSRKASGFIAKNADRVVESNTQVIALGLSKHLDEFTHVVNGQNWKHWAKDDPLNWQRAFNDVVSNPSNKVAFNLTGVDVWPGLTRAASGRGGPTDWELLMVKSNPQWWPRITWYKGGRIIDNPFE